MTGLWALEFWGETVFPTISLGGCFVGDVYFAFLRAFSQAVAEFSWDCKRCLLEKTDPQSPHANMILQAHRELLEKREAAKSSKAG